MGLTRLQQALERGMRPGADLAEELAALGDYAIGAEEDADAVIAALTRLPVPATVEQVDRQLTPLLWLFSDAESEEAVAVFAEDGLPVARRHFDAMLDKADDFERVEAMLCILKLLAFYRDEAFVDCIAAAASTRLAPESYQWSAILESLDDDHPFWPQVIEVLRDPFPEGHFAVAYLDLANNRAIDGDLEEHPFNTPAGKACIRDWLRGEDPDEYSYAQSAAASIPFISDPQRTEFLALALDHPDARVQREAAWASARFGSEGGVKILARFCQDVKHAAVACEYLRELGRDDAIPTEALAPRHVAMAELSRWLEHPGEFGSAPDEITLVDTRELYWPPTNDWRRMWIFRYVYEPGEEGDSVHTGVGMVGSMTFSLALDDIEDRPPEEIYGLHCCLELQCNEDDRAPADLDAAYGWKLICAES